MSNSSYTSISNMASNLNSLNATHVRANLVDTSKLHVAGIRSNVVTGYLPSNFTGAGSAALNSIEGALSATDVNDPNILSLPAGAVVTKVIVQRVGTVNVAGPATIDLGLNDYNTSVSTGSAQIINDLTPAIINTSGQVVVREVATFGSTGVSRLFISEKNYVSVTFSTNPLSAGSFVVKVYYES